MYPAAFSKRAAEKNLTPEEYANQLIAELEKKLKPPFVGFLTEEEKQNIQYEIDNFKSMRKKVDPRLQAKLVEEQTGINPIEEEKKRREQLKKEFQTWGMLSAAAAAAALFFFA